MSEPKRNRSRSSISTSRTSDVTLHQPIPIWPYTTFTATTFDLHMQPPQPLLQAQPQPLPRAYPQPLPQAQPPTPRPLPPLSPLYATSSHVTYIPMHHIFIAEFTLFPPTAPNWERLQTNSTRDCHKPDPPARRWTSTPLFLSICTKFVFYHFSSFRMIAQQHFA